MLLTFSAIIKKLTTDYDFSKKKIILVGWSIGAPVSLTFMKKYPNVKIDGFVSVCGLVNSTYGAPDPEVVPVIQAITDPQEHYSEVITGLNTIFSIGSFKPFSDELVSIFLGVAVKAPLAYRTLFIRRKYKKIFIYFLFFFKKKVTYVYIFFFYSFVLFG